MSRTRFAPFVLCVLLALFASPLALAQDDTGGNAAPAETAQSGPDEAAVAAAVAEAAAVIQAEPPVHERAEPWSVPVSELELEIQPLSKEVIDERLGAWKGLLEQAIRERNRLNIAAGKEEFADIRSELNAEAQEKQVRIEQLKERALLLVELLKDRGGDASEHERYIAQATGQKLNPLDFEQVLAWLQSPTGGIKIALNILRFIAVLFVFWIASRIIGGIVKTAMGRVAKGQSDLLKTIVGNSVRRVVLIIGVVIALGQLGVNIGPLVAAIGAAGLVIGLALQGVLSNFASGILILVNKPYDVGDVISAGGVTGKVERMTLVNTKVLTFDNQIMHVPNDAIWSGVITN
ncbi:MAG: mechanosensitive ion channel domain-containing protein, partial [Planctomycetota bacterium]